MSSQAHKAKEIEASQQKKLNADVAAARRLVSSFTGTKCHKCCKPLLSALDPLVWFDELRTAIRTPKSFALSSFACSACKATTCVGCGKKPSGACTQWTKGCNLSYCCVRGRAFAAWALVCKFDSAELKHQGIMDEASARKAPRAVGTGRGTGYAGFEGIGDSSKPLEFTKTDKTYDATMENIFAMLAELLPSAKGPPRGPPPSGLVESLRLSLLQDRLAQLVRNDNMTEFASRNGVFSEVLSLTKTLLEGPETAKLVLEERYHRQKTPGLAYICLSKEVQSLKLASGDSALASALYTAMANLLKQCKTLVRSIESDKTVRETAQEFIEVENMVQKDHKDLLHKLERSQPKDEWLEWSKDNCIKFDPTVIDHIYYDFKIAASSLTQSPKGRVTRLVREITTLTTSLPLGVFLRVQEDRPDLIKAMMVGPEGTPYEGGLFEFDLFCPMQYPNEPPKVICRTALNLSDSQAMMLFTGNEYFLNPNLHADGKTCLSLLGTFPAASEAEKWQPRYSGLLQVFISLLGMIFVEEPYLNMPMAEEIVQRQGVSAAIKDRGRRGIQVPVVAMAMLRDVELDSSWDGFWKELLRAYWKMRGKAVLECVRNWARENPGLRDARMTGPRSGFHGSLISRLEAALKMRTG